ncbi:MAG: UPF0280 family protein [Nitrososphaerota archaeon]|uniref:UPF0280 family protein n=1 Tax=Candidatus Bathycorpusculum sp. TaxID=2994959 RepID=UPI00281D9D35|nr:UPF0280 family protein [Candidatus Termitimicrobium sp.]MCL2432565.1 UPF0280 family protein [Candidatus Termitimicrobium sp.]MDR0493035.1 UPF0280 family protein [Nitrososphaerota archaeon]
MTDILIKENFNLKESQCTLISDSPKAIEAAKESIRRNRFELELYIRTNPKFLYTLTPIVAPKKPLVAKMMAEAATKAEVGPMAAVAGAIADLAVTDMKQTGCKVAVVENGGEIMADSDQPVDVAVAAGEEALSRRFGFRLNESPIAIATSSGRFSHALSFGDAEAAIVFTENATLADATATAVGNVIKGENTKTAIQAGIKRGLSIKEIQGVMIIYKGQVGTGGKIPQIIKIT